MNEEEREGKGKKGSTWKNHNKRPFEGSDRNLPQLKLLKTHTYIKIV